MERDDAASQPLLGRAGQANMVKYGTGATPADTSADQPAAAQPDPSAKDASRKKCIRISLIVMFSSGVVLAIGLLAGLLTRHANADDGAEATPDNSTVTTRPNIIMIMTDDQDQRLGSTSYMSALQSEIFAKGTQFSNHYTTQALCCPARSSLLRGQQMWVALLARRYHRSADYVQTQHKYHQRDQAWRYLQQVGALTTGSRLFANVDERRRVQN